MQAVKMRHALIRLIVSLVSECTGLERESRNKDRLGPFSPQTVGKIHYAIKAALHRLTKGLAVWRLGVEGEPQASDTYYAAIVKALP